MKIAVMGAGAVGCYYGGMLARAGHAVTLIGRPQHVRGDAPRRPAARHAALRRARSPLGASTEAGAVAGAGAGAVLRQVDRHRKRRLRDCAPHLAPDALVLSLQNGVDNADRLRDGAARSEVAAGGGLRGHRDGRPGPRAAPRPRRAGDRAVAASAEAARRCSRPPACRPRSPTTCAGALWAKLILNCAYNALSAIAQLPYGRLVQGAGVDGRDARRGARNAWPWRAPTA